MAVETERHDRVQGLLAVYALGALDDDDRKALESHLAECRPCRHRAFTHLESAALVASFGLTPEVPTRVRGRAGSD